MDRLVLTLLCTAVHIPSISMRYAPFRELVEPKRKPLLSLIYFFTLCVIALVYYFVDIGNLVLVHKLILHAATFFLATVNLLLIPGHWREHWCAAGLASVQISAAYYGSMFLCLHLFDIDSLIMQIATSSLITLLIFCFFSKLYINSTRRTITPFLGEDSKEYWQRVWFLPMLLFFAMFFSTPLDNYTGELHLLICRLFILATTISLCSAVAKDYEYMRHRVELAQHVNIQQDYYEALCERVAIARKNRHDFKHHMAAIRRYIDNDDKSGLNDYWNELSEHVSHVIEVPYTGNSALDGVLLRYAKLCHQHQIRFSYSGTIQKVAMSNTELCALLGNALDNAYTGCLTLPQDRFITVSMRKDHNEQSIMIENSYDGIIHQAGGQILSRKRDHAPGVGLDSMRSICDSSGAHMDVRYDEHVFRVLLLIPSE